MNEPLPEDTNTSVMEFIDGTEYGIGVTDSLNGSHFTYEMEWFDDDEKAWNAYRKLVKEDPYRNVVAVRVMGSHECCLRF